MDDFLHNLRTGKNKPFDRKRRTYDNSHNRMQDRQGNRNRRPYHQNRDFSNETMNNIRKVLEEISGNQRKMAEINNRRVAVEERKAEALESLVAYLKESPVPAIPVPAAAQPAPVAVAEPVKPVQKPSATEPETATQVLSRGEIITRIKKHRKAGLSYEKVALKLEEEGVQTLSGRGRWRGQTIYRLANGG